MFCPQQIHVPTALPDVLKQFAKAAIKTQPYDLLKWSCTYFQALSNKTKPPVKTRLEYPLIRHELLLTPGYLKLFWKLSSSKKTVSWTQLLLHWDGLCMPAKNLIRILLTGSFKNPREINVVDFIAVCAGHLTGNLRSTMVLVCDVLTEEPDGGTSIISCDEFIQAYKYLAGLDRSVDVTIKNTIFTKTTAIEILDPNHLRNSGGLNTNEPETKPKVETSQMESRPSVVPVEFIDYKRDSNGETKKSIDSGPQSIASMHDQHESLLENADYLKQSIELIDSNDNTARESLTSNETRDNLTERSTSDGITQSEMSPGSVNLGKKLTKKRSILRLDNLKGGTSSVASNATTFDDLHCSFKDVEDDRITLYRDDILNGQTDAILTREDSYNPACMLAIENLPVQEEYFISAVKGIGPTVPDDMQCKFLEFIKNCANDQSGMVMPRNLRHFLCPPMQLVNDMNSTQILETIADDDGETAEESPD